jgi:hypothetical protein
LASNATSNAAEYEKPQVDRGRVRGEEFKDMEEQDDFSSKRIFYAIPAMEEAVVLKDITYKIVSVAS